MRKKHAESFAQFSATFPDTTVQKWKKVVDDWKADRLKPNPYEEPVNGKHETKPAIMSANYCEIYSHYTK